MKYRKIKVSSIDAPKRFYRVLYVREDLNLFQLGVTILSAFDCKFCHMFMFYDKSNSYVDKLWLEDSICNVEFDDLLPQDKDYEEYKICDLDLKANNTFKLCYDTGENWEFEIKIYKAAKDIDENFFGTLIMGEGAYIWEDNHYLFWTFLDGGSDAISKEEKEFLLEVLNIDVEKFDDILDIEAINEDVENAEFLCEELLEMREMYL